MTMTLNSKFFSTRWWEWYQYCEDDLGLCQSNIDAVAKLSGGDLSKALHHSDNELSFSIVRQSDVGYIPQNYFCQWKFEIDAKQDYQLSISRNFSPLREKLELNIIGETK